TTLLRAAFAERVDPPSELQRQALAALAEADAAWLVANIHQDLTSFGLPEDRERIAALAGVTLAVDRERVSLLQARMLSSRVARSALEMYQRLTAGQYANDAGVWREQARLQES